LADYIWRETVDAVTMPDRHELPPEPGVTYAAFCDPSGGVSDSLTLAIAHLDRNAVYILDALLPDGHDDLANAVAGVLVGLELWSIESRPERAVRRSSPQSSADKRGRSSNSMRRAFRSGSKS
jgi:hypothetical protein